MHKKSAIGFLLISFCGASFASEGFTKAEICKAAISTEMGRAVKTMKTIKSSDDFTEISYTRSDGNKYRYQCRIENGRVVWRTYFNDQFKTGWGRWRDTDPNDPVLTYKIMNDVLSVHDSSTGTAEKFTKKDY